MLGRVLEKGGGSALGAAGRAGWSCSPALTFAVGRATGHLNQQEIPATEERGVVGEGSGGAASGQTVREGLSEEVS